MRRVESSIREVIALSAKMYSILKGDGGNEKKAKGVNKGVTKHMLDHEQYRQTNETGFTVRKEMRRITSVNYQLFTECVSKKSLTWLDLKSHVTMENEVIYPIRSPTHSTLQNGRADFGRPY